MSSVLFNRLLAASALLGSGIFGSVAFADPPIAVNCPASKLSTAINNAFASATVGSWYTFNVTGTCVDHISVPVGGGITINGAPGAKLVGDTASSPVIANYAGQIVINDMTITTPLASDEVVVVGSGGWMGLFRSTLSAPLANNIVHINAAGSATIEDTKVTGSKNSAVEIGPEGFAWIDATQGRATNITYNGTQGGQAIGCWAGSFGVGTNGTGTVTIGPSTAQGISSRGCRALIGGGGMVKNSVRITGARDAGIRAKADDMYNLVKTKIDGNPSITIEMSAGVAEIDNSTIAVPLRGGIKSRRGAVIYFNHIIGKSSVTGTTPYSCSQGGKIYADTNYSPTGGATSPGGCLTIGGPSTN